jgi:transposase-like protein
MEPATLQEAIKYFSDPVNCREYLVARRWPDGVACPRCGSRNVLFLEKYNRWHCREKHDAPQFTLKTGTIMEDSPIGLDKWLMAIWQVVNSKNGISSCEVARAIGVTQKTAWFLDHRIRAAMQDEKTGGKLGGEVEIDETFIGGKARNMHKSRKLRQAQQSSGRGMQGGAGKTIVLGMLERGKTVRAAIIEDRGKASMQPVVRANVEKGTQIHSDEWAGGWRMDDEYTHNVVNHLECYVDGNVHTNGIENFWSLLKRTIGGTYVSVEPFHLFRYVDEQAFRFNNRKPMDDGDRFSYVVRKIVGKRLTWDKLTGKEASCLTSVN